MTARFLVFYIGALLLSGNLFAAPKQDKGIEAAAKDAVRGILKDPSSVQFKGLIRNSDGDVCGQYNAKNSYGGYEGFESFMYEKSSKSLLNIKVISMRESFDKFEEVIKSTKLYSQEIQNSRKSSLDEIHKLESRIVGCEVK